MTDGDVDVVLAVVGLRDREQRGDRPALHDRELGVDKAPLDVLWAAGMRFDPPSETHEPHDLGAGQRRLVPPLEVDGLLLCATGGRGEYGELLGGDRRANHLAV